MISSIAPEELVILLNAGPFVNLLVPVQLPFKLPSPGVSVFRYNSGVV